MSRVPKKPSSSPERLRICRGAFDALLDPTAATNILPLLSDSSSTVDLEAVKLLQVFHGGDTGNYDQCTEMMTNFHHCLAGSTDRRWTIGMVVSPFAGICVPDTCWPAELQSSEMQNYIATLAGTVQGSPLSISPGQVQAMRYLQTINETLSAVNYLNTGITCGNHAYERTYQEVGSSAWWTASALCFFVAAAILSVVVRAYGPRWCSKAQSTRDSSRLSGGNDRPQATVPREVAGSYGAMDSDSAADAEPPRKPDYLVGTAYAEGTEPLKYDARAQEAATGGVGGEGGANEYGGVVLRAFDFGVNFKRLFTVDDHKRGAFRALDGLRVLSILWVILGHSLAELNLVGFSNPTNVLPPYGLTHEVGAQLFFSARLAVDTFLLLSGFLVTLGMLRRFSAPTESAAVACVLPTLHQWLPAFYLNRVLRILPLYAACLGFWWQIAPSLGFGPFWYAWDGYVDKCERLWWANLLFINNLIPANGSETDGCL